MWKNMKQIKYNRINEEHKGYHNTFFLIKKVIPTQKKLIPFFYCCTLIISAKISVRVILER